MATTNRDRVIKALKKLQQGLMPFVHRETETSYRDAWKKQVVHRLHKAKGNPYLDARDLFKVM